MDPRPAQGKERAVPNPRLTVSGPVLRSLGWIFLLSRLFFIEVACLAYIYLPHAWVESPQGTLPPPGGLIDRVLVGLWMHWDGFWYYSISTYGYRGRPTATAFFPLYPLAMHLLGGSALSGITVSLVSLAGTFWFFYQLIQRDLGPRVAWFSILALAFFPTTFYANAVYSESLFLVLATATLYFARTRRYWIAGPLGALATCTSIYGTLLSIPLLVLIWKQERPKILPLGHVLWPPSGLGAYMAFLVPLFGDPFVFERAQSNWRRHFEPFYRTLWQGAQSAGHAAVPAFTPSILFATGLPSTTASNFYNFLFAGTAIIVVLLTARRVPFYLVAYAAAALLVPLSYPAMGNPLMSLPRLILEAFPVFLSLGLIMSESIKARWVYFGVSLPLGALFVSLFATAHWVA